MFRSRKPKACGREGTLSPPIGDGSKMPFHDFRCCVSVELVTDVDETLNGGNILVVDGGEVKDYSTQDGPAVIEVGGLAATRTRIIPRTVLGEA